MAWVYLDDQFPDHPKVAAAGGDAAWLFICGLAYCRRYGTEGKIPRAQVPRLSDRKAPMKLAAKLIEVRLWIEDPDGFQVHDYSDWNRPGESKSEAGRKAANARWSKAKKDAKRNADASDSHSDRIESAYAGECTIPIPVPNPTDVTPPTPPKQGGSKRATVRWNGDAPATQGPPGVRIVDTEDGFIASLTAVN